MPDIAYQCPSDRCLISWFNAPLYTHGLVHSGKKPIEQEVIIIVTRYKRMRGVVDTDLFEGGILLVRNAGDEALLRTQDLGGGFKVRQVV